MDEELYAGPRGSGEDGERHHTYARAKTGLRSGRNHRRRVSFGGSYRRKGEVWAALCTSSWVGRKGDGALRHRAGRGDFRPPSSGKRGFLATVEWKKKRKRRDVGAEGREKRDACKK